MKKILKENIGYIVLILLIIIVRMYLVTPVRVSGHSMDRTLKNGEIMLLNKTASYTRKSIVVVSKEVEGNTIIKRIIALPGERIKCEDGVIYINNKKYEEKYVFGNNTDFEEITLKKDEYFVMGDNRTVSLDSRFFGPVKAKYIEGVSDIVLFPFNKVGKVK